MSRGPCPFCQVEFLVDDLQHCPHCARPAHFPNVVRAEKPAERDALEQRYREARASLDARGCSVVGDEFEEAVSTSHAVLNRTYHETERLASSDQEIYATYHQLIGAGVRIPNGDQWDPLRFGAGAALFGGYSEHVRFAALSIDGRGPANYGEMTWSLRESMIAHRASVFHENSAVFFGTHGTAAMKEPPLGYRATWADRGRLALAKHHSELQPAMKSEEFANVLLRSGASTADDVFVEVHVGGSMTAHSLSAVSVAPSRGRRSRSSLRKGLRAMLARLGITLA